LENSSPDSNMIPGNRTMCFCKRSIFSHAKSPYHDCKAQEKLSFTSQRIDFPSGERWGLQPARSLQAINESRSSVLQVVCLDLTDLTNIDSTSRMNVK
jgi:hypothetical protein